MALDATLTLESISASAEVDAIRYKDALSELFDLDVEFLSDDPEINLSAALGKSAKLAFASDDLVPAITGIVAEAEQLTSVPGGASRYHVRIVPLEWLATQRKDSRIFQNKSIPDIVKEVYAFLGEAPAAKLGGSYEAREYTVQYGETDHVFVQRLLAEEGIGFYFDHSRESRLTLFDDSSADLGDKRAIPFRPQRLGEELIAEHVSHVARVARLTPGKLSLTDFDHDKPALDLGESHDAEAALASEPALEFFEHDIGTYRAASEGKKIAARILEGLRKEGEALDVLASFIASAGTEIALSEHPRDDLNAPFRVTSSDIAMRFGETSRPRLRVMPKATPFRPTRVGKPRISGTQTAIVVGDAGEEIDVDEQARVKVAFHWDRRGIRQGAPTRRIRVSQGWAGAGYGFMMLPRVGDDVIVSYLDGNPDEPIIIGRVHNGTAPAPLKLPGDKTRSIWRSQSTDGATGDNHIMMEDKRGSELLDIRAQLDMTLHAERHATISYGKNASESIGANHTQSVEGNQDIKVKGNRSIDVYGDLSITAVGELGEMSAKHSIKSGPVSVDATTIGLDASGLIASTAPTITMKGSAAVVAEAPVVSVAASGNALVTAPITVLEGAAFAVLKSGAIVAIDGTTVSISGAATVNVSSGAEVTVSAPTVNVSGSGTVTVSGGTANVSGGTVNITGGTVAIN